LNRATLVVAFALIALSGVAVGCGGGGSGGGAGGSTGGGNGNNTESASSNSAAPSTQTFVQEADAICTQTRLGVEREVKALLEKRHIKEVGQKGESAKEVTALSIEEIEEIGIPQLRREANELRALQAPKQQAAQFGAYLDVFDELVEASEKNPKVLLGPGARVFAKPDAKAKPIGFKVCGVH
jgi:hypothetical protein